MKRYLLLLITALVGSLQAQVTQTQDLNHGIKSWEKHGKVQHFTLSNGMQVYLLEDQNMRSVLGAVAIKGGAKYDPKDATGIAHYLEHMMFKGTTEIGTTNYAEERIWLDSVAFMYEMLPYSKGDTAYRRRILKKVDYYSQKASAFAIPGEFDRLIKEIGGTGLNAYTTYESIVYHNFFPAEYLKEWLDLYYHRFDKPVFRLFQTELETVYEEKNMAMDNSFRQVFRAAYRHFYPHSVYGRQSVLGSVEHLKNPSVYKMVSYWKQHYVANNMALILIGNFNKDEALALIKNSFGHFRSGDEQHFPKEQGQNFTGSETITERISPIPAGILGYRIPPALDKDLPALEVLSQLFSNNNGTGLMDSLTKENQVLSAGSLMDLHSDQGGLFFYYIPKLPFRGLAHTEKLVLKQLERIKKGDFDTKLLEAIKLSLIKQRMLNEEQPRFNLRVLVDEFVAGRAPAYEYAQQVSRLKKADIVNIANKYLTKNHLSIHFKSGIKKHEKLKKPDFTPVTPSREQQQSKYARNFTEKLNIRINPLFISKGVDYQYDELEKGLQMYAVKNPYNKIFRLRIIYRVSENKIPGLSLAAEYFNNIGAGQYSYHAFQQELQSLGADMQVSASRKGLTITVTGNDDNLEQTLALVHRLLQQAHEDKKALKKLRTNRRLENLIASRDHDFKARMLQAYIMYGQHSPYIDRLSLKQLKKYKAKDLIAMVNRAQQYATEVHYSGSMNIHNLSSLWIRTMGRRGKFLPPASPYTFDFCPIQDNTLFILNDKKAIQTRISVFTLSRPLDKEERLGIEPFNTYFGRGLSSVIFKELREYRSLAYTAYALYKSPWKYDKPTGLLAYTSTQADKTVEALSLMLKLIDDMPKNAHNAEFIRLSLINSFNNHLPSFRNSTEYIAERTLLGLSNADRQARFTYYRQLQFKDIHSFYMSNVAGRLHHVALSGNTNKFSTKPFSKTFTIRTLKLKQLRTK